MTLPGVSYTIRDTAPARSAPAGTSRWFVTGFTERGPLEPVKVTSIAQFVDRFGDRLSHSYLYDSLDVAFRDGLAEAWVSRVIGTTPVLATAKLLDASGSADPADVSLIATAVEHGTWANGLNVAVTVDGTNFAIAVSHDDDVSVVEESGALADRAAAVAWAATSDYIRLALGASAEDPRAGTYGFTLGDDDYDTATEAEWLTALDRFGSDLGGGQVSMPGRTTDEAHDNILDHCGARNRTPLLDGEDTATVATLVTTAVNGRAHEFGKLGGLFAPWATGPGVVGGSTRTVPYSAVQAGLIARSDGKGNAPNVAAAGDNGVSRWATGLSQAAWTDAEREVLNDAGVNVARVLNGAVVTYGYRTLADPSVDPAWVGLGGAREVAYILTEAQRIGETFAFDQIDGRGRKISEWGGALAALCATEYDRDALYGNTQSQAFLVDVGAGVNTPETIAEGKLRAVLALKTSPMAEAVEIEVVKLLTTDTI